MGRKPLYREETKNVSVRLPLSTVAYYTFMGNGNIAAGIVSVERQLQEAERRGNQRIIEAAAAGQSVIDVVRFLTAETPPELPYVPYLPGRDTARVIVLSLRPENRGKEFVTNFGQVVVDGAIVRHKRRQDAG